MRAIYGKSTCATADGSSAGAVRARRLCAGLVVARALFGSAAPAHADDGLTLGGLGGTSVGATVAAVQAAAVAQATAIVNEAAKEAAPAPQPPPAQAPTTPQTGSASGVGSGISTDAPTPAQSTAGVQPAAAAAQPASEPAVVAPTPAVVSQPDDSATSPPVPAQRSAAPSGMFHRLAREYQQNPARYHAMNSLPISHETVPASTLESIGKGSPFTSDTSAQKQDSNPASNSARDVPESGSRTAPDAPTPHASHAHVAAVASGAPPGRTAATPHDAAGAVEHRIDRPSAVAGVHTQPLVVKTATATAAPSRPATSAKPKHAAPSRPIGASASGGRGSAADRAGVAQVPRHVDSQRSRRARIRTETAQREAARADRPVESPWPWVGLVLLLFGLTSIGVAFASVGAGGAAAVGGIAARVRTTAVSAAAIGTRLRSKELSAGADGATDDRPVTRGIRYRD